jgi:DNA-binding NarL/FixJ family response regulator
MKPIRIVLADDHRLIREGIRQLLKKFPDFEVVGEASDGRELLELVEALQPDVLLTDIGMTGMNGLEAAARIAKDWPQVRVVLLTMHRGEEFVGQALRSGAVGYLLKDSDPAELDLAIRTVLRGETYLTPVISKQLVEDYLLRVDGPMTSDKSLSPRQREILQLIAESKSTKEIAGILRIGAKTVETHRAQLMQRVGVHDVAGLVRYAIRIGLVSPES